MAAAARFLDRGMGLFLLLSLGLHAALFAGLRLGESSATPPSREVVQIRLAPPAEAELAEPEPVAPEPELPAPPTETVATPATPELAAQPEVVPPDRVLPPSPVGQPGFLPPPPAPPRPAGEGRASYEQLLASRLLQYRQYPRRAQREGIEGEGTLALTLAPHGGLVAARVASSAGHPLLDRELLALAERAAPYPPLPGGGEVEFLVPVSFRLQ